jgi:hypothetical protein
MTRPLMSVPALALLLMLVPSVALTQTRQALTGVWTLDNPREAALEHVQPVSEEISVTTTTVTVRRGDLSTPTVLYPLDGAERPEARLGGTRLCRTAWEQEVLVIACRSTEGGPGGGAPPVYTRETRQVDADGRLVVTVTWRSGDSTTTRTSRYRQAVRR